MPAASLIEIRLQAAPSGGLPLIPLPIIFHDLRHLCRRPGFYLVRAILPAIGATFLVAHPVLGGITSWLAGGTPAAAARAYRVAFEALVLTQWLALVVVAPTLGAWRIHRERDSGGLDLLQIAGVSRSSTFLQCVSSTVLVLLTVCI